MCVRTMNASKHGIPDSYYSMQWNAPSVHTMNAGWWALYKNLLQLHAFVLAL